MTTLLVWIVIILAIITIVRVVRILELVGVLSGDKEEITDRDNKFNAWMMMVFLFVGLGGMIYFTLDAKKYLLPVSASKHGVVTDHLLNINFLIIVIVFFITQILLFVFAFKYKHKKGEKAYFYPINHTLEFVWTIIPTIVLGALIISGLKVWNSITAPAPKNSMEIELYGKQFDWTARYAGGDNVLGRSNFKLITDENALGVDVNDHASADDKIVKELHIPVNTTIRFVCHSRDVIHSAYFPHLRSQINCVPGMTTEMVVEATITTDSMRLIQKNPKFDYVLLCNKICGIAHYNMNMKVVIESAADFKRWYKDQPLVFQPATAPATSQPDSAKVVASK
jgi:cytochrome c oxidase subunit 2